MKNFEKLGQPLDKHMMKTVIGGTAQLEYTLWFCTTTPDGYGPYVCNETNWGDPSGGMGSCQIGGCTPIGGCWGQSPLCPN